MNEWMNAAWMNEWMQHEWMNECSMNEWMNAAWMNEWMQHEWMNAAWMNEWMQHEWMNECSMNEWMNAAWMNEWMQHEWMNEWMQHEWMIECSMNEWHYTSQNIPISNNFVLMLVIVRFSSRPDLSAGLRLSGTKCLQLVSLWSKISHSNLVTLRELFTTKSFGDNCEWGSTNVFILSQR